MLHFALTISFFHRLTLCFITIQFESLHFYVISKTSCNYPPNIYSIIKISINKSIFILFFTKITFYFIIKSIDGVCSWWKLKVTPSVTHELRMTIKYRFLFPAGFYQPICPSSTFESHRSAASQTFVHSMCPCALRARKPEKRNNTK